MYQKTTRNSYLESKDGPARPPSNMDRFERCFSIFKLEQSQVNSDTRLEASSYNSGTTDGMEERHSGSSWRAVRVDLVVSPYSQFAFATLGWTGSKVRYITNKLFINSQMGLLSPMTLICTLLENY